MKRSLLAGLGSAGPGCGAAGVGGRSAAWAMPYKAPAYVAGYNWTGFYLGINGGGGWGNSDWNGFAVSNSPSGGMVGGTVGYNWQGVGSPWVFGLEGDIDWADIEGSTRLRGGALLPDQNNWLGTVRGRVGYAFDRIMPYVTGGLAVGDIEANRTVFAGPERHQCRLDRRRRHRSASSRRTGRPRSSISMPIYGDIDLQRRRLRHARPTSTSRINVLRPA